jgi:GNAT superfamily N-acetyltransferase
MYPCCEQFGFTLFFLSFSPPEVQDFSSVVREITAIGDLFLSSGVPMNYRIEPAVPADIDDIVRFQAAIVAETEPHPFDPAPMRDGVHRVFEDPSIGFYLVARGYDGSPAGCMLIQWEWSDWRNAYIWWVHSVYVAPEHRRRGVLRAMLGHAESLAKAEGTAGLRLLTEQGNAAAKAAYRKAGFLPGYYDVMEKMFEEKK